MVIARLQTPMAVKPLDLTLELAPRARFDVVELRSHFATEHEALAAFPHCLYWSSHTTAGFLERSLSARLSAQHVPTYVEAFGMAIVEAMAFAIPVISTNHFAIPEIIEDGTSGLLIDTTPFDCERLFSGYVVRDIPADFSAYMTDAVYSRLCRLIESLELRRSIGQAALEVARTKFSFDRRNATMLEVYRRAVAE